MATDAIVEFGYSNDVVLHRLCIATDAYPQDIVQALISSCPDEYGFRSWGNVASKMSIDLFGISPDKSMFYQHTQPLSKLDGICSKWLIRPLDVINVQDLKGSITVTQFTQDNEVIFKHTLRELEELKPMWEMVAYLKDQLWSINSGQFMLMAMNLVDYDLFLQAFPIACSQTETQFTCIDLKDFKGEGDTEITKVQGIYVTGATWEEVEHRVPHAYRTLSIALNINKRPLVGFRRYLTV